MDARSEAAIRDRAYRLVRRATISVICSVVALTGIFSTAAALNFSGKPVAAHHDAPPVLPSATPPVQKAPPAPIIVKRVVYVPYGASGSYTGTTASGGGAAPAPAPAGSGPVAAPPPPPPPACVSTPSKPC